MTKHQQTKLSKADKAHVRAAVDLAAQQGTYVFWFPDCGATVAIGPAFEGSRMGSAAVAIAAPTETKFRKWVGANEAMAAHDMGRAVPVVLPDDFWLTEHNDRESYLEMVASDLAFAITQA